ncbi:MAG TPA: hypothetical protein VN616_14815 [Puia sp.]|nr:hypothetical protein [Puia sp.]
MRSIFLLPLIPAVAGIFTADQEYVNPTGTYVLKGEIRNSRIVGHYGELRARLIDSNTVALAFYLNKGYPGYESGAFLDTLRYDDNRAVFRPRADSSCAFYFSFDPHAVEVDKGSSDPNSGCGFSLGVIIPAILQKTSSDVPVIQDLSDHGKS